MLMMHGNQRYDVDAYQQTFEAKLAKFQPADGNPALLQDYLVAISIFVMMPAQSRYRQYALFHVFYLTLI